MSEAKKFMLIEPDHVQAFSKLVQRQLNSRDQLLPHKELSQLDKNMLEIINESNVSNSEKVRRYNQALAEYQSLNEMTARPVKRDTEDGQVKIAGETEETQPYSLIGIPKPYQIKAQNLLQALLDSTNITVNSKGEVSIDGSLIPGSNATDLVHGAVNQKFKRDKLKGWQRFKDLFQRANVPRSMLGNHVFAEDNIKDTPKSKPVTPSSSLKRKTSRRIFTQSGNRKSLTSKKAKSPAWLPY